MIADDLRMATGFVLGLLVGAPILTVIYAAMVAKGNAESDMAVFQAGIAFERNRRARELGLEGDDATELGVLEA